MADMDAVNQFNAELQSLYEVKPPISKGKMTAVTRAALKGVKLYKHVVQSVEKFIQKCKTEYKIPGLYVIDSIIRQSRHQFGAEKDVFAPRFARNIQNTFMHLYKCQEEEKAKIIRVLNLWQKNRIFSPEVIQPLFDLADPNNPIWEQLQNQEHQANLLAAAAAANKPMMNNSGGPGAAISNLLSNLPSSVPFRKEVLDYDYGDDDDGDGNKNQSSGEHSQQNNVGLDALGSILANPEILRQLATLQEQIAAATSHGGGGGYPTPPEQERQRKLAELNKQEAAFDQRLAQTVARLPFAVDCELSEDGRSRKDIDQNSNQLGNNPNQLLPPPFFQQISEQQQQHHGHDNINAQHQQQQLQQQQQQAQQLLNLLGHGQRQQQEGHNNPFGLQLPYSVGPPPHFPQQDLSQTMNMYNNQDGNQSFNAYNQNQGGVEEIDLTDEPNKDKDRRDNRGRRKRSRERRSRSRSRRSRSRSRGRDGGGRDRKRYRSRSRDRKEEKEREREKEKERIRKGLPPIKKEHLSVCSTTLWVGHLSKLVSQEDLSDAFGAYGDIISIDLIPPRGCAFIVMNRRQDSLRALDRLKNTKLQGKSITVAWAPGKGMKGREWKDYWELDSGVSYLPWIKLRSDLNIEEFEDGGCVDEDTVPDYLKHNSKDKSGQSNMESENSQDISVPSGNSTAPDGGVGSLPDGMVNNSNPMGDSNNEAAAVMQNIQGPPPGHMPPRMPNPAFGMPPVGMMPMGMHVGMVPPPMMGPGGMPNFAAMGGPIGMPNFARMMPPMGMGAGPGMGGPGLLGDIPAAALANLSQMNNMSQGQIMMDHQIQSMKDDDDSKKTERKEGKRRSRFNDPDEIVQPMDESSSITSPPSQDGVKDERPVFERLKSLADGYGFGNDKAGPSLLGNPGAMLGGPPRMPGPHGFLPHGVNQFASRPPGFMGSEPPSAAPMGGGGPRSWFDAPNPFLNPNPNPFAGNPFVQSSLSENPFDIGSAPPPSDSMVGIGGPQPLFGVGVNTGGGGQERNLFETSWGGGDHGGQQQGGFRGRGGRGGGGGRDRDRDSDKGGWWNNRQNESWGEGGANDEPVGPGGWGRGRKPWGAGDRDGGEEIGGGGPPSFGGRGGRNSMGSDEGRGDRDRGSRDRDRGRRDDRGGRARSRDRDGNRRERNRSRENNNQDSRRGTNSRDRDQDDSRHRPRTHSHSQSQDRGLPMPEEENWEVEESNVNIAETQESTTDVVAEGDSENIPRQSHSPSGNKDWEESESTSAPANFNSVENSELEPSRDEHNPMDQDQEEEGHNSPKMIVQPAPSADDDKPYHNTGKEVHNGTKSRWNDAEEGSFRQPETRPDEEFSEQEHLEHTEENFAQNQHEDRSENEPQENFHPQPDQEFDENEKNKTYQEPEGDSSIPCDKNFSNFNSSQFEQQHDSEQEEQSSPQYHQDQAPADHQSPQPAFPQSNEEIEDSQDEPLHNDDYNPIQEEAPVPASFNNYQNQNSNSSGPPLYGNENEDDSRSQERFSVSPVRENHIEEENYLSNNGGCEDFNAAPVDEDDSREDVMFTNNSSSNYDGDSLEGVGQNLQTNSCDYGTNLSSKHHNNDNFPSYPNNHNTDTHLEEQEDESEKSSPLPSSNNFVGDNHVNEQHDVGVEVAEGGENGSS